jgi:hypothetical protein
MESKLMEERKRSVVSIFWYALGGGLVMAAVLLVAATRFVAPQTIYKMISGVGDDEPIIVAGGSMHIRPMRGAIRIDPRNADNLQLNETGGYVSAVEVLWFDDRGPGNTTFRFTGEPVKIDLEYCDPQQPHCKPPVSIEFTGKKDSLRIRPRGNTQPLHDGQVSYAPETNKLRSVTVVRNGGPYLCTKGECSVVVHYCRSGVCP